MFFGASPNIKRIMYTRTVSRFFETVPRSSRAALSDQVALAQLRLLDSKRNLIVPYMAPEPSKRRDRYDVTGNIEAEYVDADQTVLVNKKGITDLAQLQALEEEGLAKAYGTLLAQVRVDTLLTSELTRYVHRQIFGELYEWAGRWRTVNISKPGITWPPPEFIDENMAQWEQNVLRKYPATKLIDDKDFCNAVARDSGRVSCHPSLPRRERPNDQAADRFIGRTNCSTAFEIRPN